MIESTDRSLVVLGGPGSERTNIGRARLRNALRYLSRAQRFTTFISSTATSTTNNAMSPQHTTQCHLNTQHNVTSTHNAMSPQHTTQCHLNTQRNVTSTHNTMSPQHTTQCHLNTQHNVTSTHNAMSPQHNAMSPQHIVTSTHNA